MSDPGMAYWFPDLNVAFQCRIPPSDKPTPIFYYEALAVTSALMQPLQMKMPRIVSSHRQHQHRRYLKLA